MILAHLLACTTQTPPARVVDTPTTACEGYPDGAVRPMERDQVLYPYSWPEAIHMGTRQNAALDLGQAPCDTDPDIEWSPFDKLAFVSIPAW